MLQSTVHCNRDRVSTGSGVDNEFRIQVVICSNWLNFQRLRNRRRLGIAGQLDDLRSGTRQGFNTIYSVEKGEIIEKCFLNCLKVAEQRKKKVKQTFAPLSY